MPHTLLARITYAVFLLLCAFAIVRGDRWQKIAGLVLVIATVATPILQMWVAPTNLQWCLLLADLALLLFFGGMAIAVGRAWMIVAAAFQLLSTLSHPAAHYARQIGPFAYLSVFQVFSYGVYLTMGVAVFYGSFEPRARSFAPSSPPSFDP